MTDNPYEASRAPLVEDFVSGTVGSRAVQVRPLSRLSDAIKLIGEQYWLFVGICFVGVLIGSVVPFYVLFGPMLCGIHLCFDDRARGKPTEFQRLFKGFDYFLPSLLAILIVVLLILLVVIPLMVLVGLAIWTVGGMAPRNMGSFEMILLPVVLMFSFFSFLLYVPFVFVFALIVDQRMTAWEAVKTSWSGASKNMLGLFGMLLLFAVLTFLCSMMCYIPVIFLLPLQFGAFYLVYRDVFPNASTAFPVQPAG